MEVHQPYTSYGWSVKNGAQYISLQSPCFRCLNLFIVVPPPRPTQSTDPPDSCRIREPLCTLKEGMYYPHYTSLALQFRTAVVDHETAVQPTAETPRLARGCDPFSTQDSAELSEEAERLHQRWLELELITWQLSGITSIRSEKPSKIKRTFAERCTGSG